MGQQFRGNSKSAIMLMRRSIDTSGGVNNLPTAKSSAQHPQPANYPTSGMVGIDYTFFRRFSPRCFLRAPIQRGSTGIITVD